MLAIDVKNLTKSFNNKVAVDNISLQVKTGEICGFLGPNGSGKTTTMRMLCGLLTPDHGEGTCLGFNVLTQSAQIKSLTGYMTQKFSLYTDLSIYENIDFIAKLYNVVDREKTVQATIASLGISKELQNKLTGQLSGGWQQRVALAAAIMHNPKLLLLDEPTAGVDPRARKEFWDILVKLSAQGITTLVSTHYMDEAERCSQLVYIAYGNILISGTKAEVLQKANATTLEESFINLMEKNATA